MGGVLLSKLKELILLTIGTLLVAVGIYFFKFPNNFSTGGVSGIAVILGSVSPILTPGTFVLIINVILLLLGFAVFGLSFGVKTVYSSILLSFSIFILEIIFPMSKPVTNQPFLELVFSIIFSAVGSAILFNKGASTGGTDIVAMILKKYTCLDVGKALLCSDAAIAILAGLVFGIETGMFSALGLLAKAFIIDNIIEGMNLSKYFTIITDYPQEISYYIHNTLHRGATIWECTGAFSNNEKKAILTVLNRSQSILLKKYVKSVDNHAFVIISNTSDILGKGFREHI